MSTHYLELHPVLRHFFRFWLWLSSGTVTREWVAVHRRHHAFADKPGDLSIPEYSTPRPLVLHPALLDEKALENLRTLTRRHEVLRVVVEFRDRLQAIWDSYSGTDGRAVQQLRELCHFANNSRISALGDFAARLQRYGHGRQ
jgi:hypothetical protein